MLNRFSSVIHKTGNFAKRSVQINDPRDFSYKQLYKKFNKTLPTAKENTQQDISEIIGTKSRELQKNIKNFYQKQKANFNENVSQDTQEHVQEILALIAGGIALAKASDYYSKNKEHLTSENIQNQTETLLEKTIPASYLTKHTEDAKKTVLNELNNIVNRQTDVSKARSITSQLSPAFTLVPQLAQPAFITTTTLSTADAVMMLRVLRLKKMIELRPDIIPNDKQAEYETKINNVIKHFPREILFDLLKTTYRGQLVTVNKKLRKNAKPDQDYKNPILKELTHNRLIPSKNNLPIVGWVLPTSYIISNLAANDTKDLKEDLQKLHRFIQEI